MKKLLAALLLMMVLCMTAPAFAAEKTYSGVCVPITVNADGEHTVILNGVTIEATDSPAISVEAPADKLTVILRDGTKNYLTGGSLSAGIANNGVTLVIRCESAGEGHECGENCGVLYAYGGDGGGAGIGGNAYRDLEGTVIIEGGNVSAEGIYYSPGIGGANLTGELIITGGKVVAKGPQYDEGGEGAISFNVGAGIGTGTGGDLSGSVTITGGYVEVTGGSFGAGIGSAGAGNLSGTVTIAGGEVLAQGAIADAIGVCAQREGVVTGKVIVHPADGRIEGEAAGYNYEEMQALIGSAFTNYTDVTNQLKDKEIAHFIHIAPPATPVPSPVPAVPQTGDNSNVILWSALVFISLMGITLVSKRKEA